MARVGERMTMRRRRREGEEEEEMEEERRTRELTGNYLYPTSYS
jgi:hypothetical protein